MRGLTAYIQAREPFDYILNTLSVISIGLFGYVHWYQPNMKITEPNNTPAVQPMLLSKISSVHNKQLAEIVSLNASGQPVLFAMRERIDYKPTHIPEASTKTTQQIAPEKGVVQVGVAISPQDLLSNTDISEVTAASAGQILEPVTALSDTVLP